MEFRRLKAAAQLTAQPLRVRLTIDAALPLFHFGFERTAADLRVSMSRATIRANFKSMVVRVPSALRIVKGLAVGTAGIVDVSDGDHTIAGGISMCSNKPCSVLIPDADFLETRGFEALRPVAASAPPFAERRDVVLWRGGTTGVGLVAVPGMTAATPGLIQRTRMCLLLRDAEGCDVKFAGVNQSTDPEADRHLLEEAGLMGAFVDTKEWANVRYHVAVDGNTAAWSSTFTRLLLGCCVIKPESPGGFLQWYFKHLSPREHYVPVRADLSDLFDAIEWCRTHPKEAAAIAAAGRKVALSLEYEPEVDAARRRIEAAFQSGRLALANRHRGAIRLPAAQRAAG